MSSRVWVLDTNVIVSAALTSGGTCDQILRAAIDGRVRLAWSTPMLAEYREVLARPKFGFSPAVVSSLLSTFGPAGQVTPDLAPALPDPDDEVFLSTALATEDQVLVTGNTAHFPIGICAPVNILTPTEALRFLASLENR